MLGFTRLLASVEDLALDFPDAAHTLSLFLGRAVVDEALPPSFLAAVLTSLRYDSLGVAVVHATGASPSAEHMMKANAQYFTIVLLFQKDTGDCGVILSKGRDTIRLRDHGTLSLRLH